MASGIPLPEGNYLQDIGMTPEEELSEYEDVAAFATNGAEGAALALITLYRFGGFDGAHHKDWALDQIARVLTGSRYEEFVAYAKDGEDGPDTYTWDTGIAP